jgi:hypothetical protein
MYIFTSVDDQNRDASTGLGFSRISTPQYSGLKVDKHDNKWKKHVVV